MYKHFHKTIHVSEEEWREIEDSPPALMKTVEKARCLLVNIETVVPKEAKCLPVNVETIVSKEKAGVINPIKESQVEWSRVQ